MICMKTFDGSFDKKTEQAEALEFLQSVNKIVDGERFTEMKSL